MMKHNSKPWRVATNRHTNTDGTSWGWIDGTEPTVYWSNGHGSKLTREQAGKLVAEHNAWLDAQTPVALRLQKARERWHRLNLDAQRAQEAYEAAREKLTAAQLDIDVLEAEQAVSA